MSKILDLITEGFCTIGDAYVVRPGYVRPGRNGFQKDQENLRGDARRVGKTLSGKIAAYHGKQSNPTTSR